MKNKKTLALTASIFVLSLAAGPHRALAAQDVFLHIDGIPSEQSSSTPPASQPAAIRKAGGSNLIYLQYAQILLSALLP